MRNTMRNVRPPAVAGAFYPGDAGELIRDVDGMLAGAKRSTVRPKALVVPHAGYVYSGPIAASAYASLENLDPKPTKVVLLGPAHHVGLHGLALPGVDGLRTPLGVVSVDRELEFLALKFPFVVESHPAHDREHSLEVQLPFLQRVLGPDFTVLPLCVGHASPHEVEQLLNAVWGGDETLIVVSSDLSHYLPYEEAQNLDATTARRIVALDELGLEDDQACGSHPLRGLLLAARAHGLKVQQLDLRNSGDTAGDKGRVVGYGAFALVPGVEA